MNNNAMSYMFLQQGRRKLRTILGSGGKTRHWKRRQVHVELMNDDWYERILWWYLHLSKYQASSCSTGWPPRPPRRRTQQLQPCRRSSAPPLDFPSATVVDRALWEWRMRTDRSNIRTIAVPDDHHVRRTFKQHFFLSIKPFQHSHHRCSIRYTAYPIMWYYY